MRKNRLQFGLTGILLVFIAALLISCGGGGGGGSDGDSSSTAGNTAAITLSADPASISADGGSSSTITATLTDSTTNPVAQGTAVTFSTTLGTLSSSTTSTADDTGILVVSLIAGTTAGTAIVTATSNSVTQATSVEFTGSGEGSVASVQLSASPASVKSNNSDSSTVTATVLDASNAVIQGITVSFSADGGQISAPSAVTDADGQAAITFKSGTSDPSNKVVTITGTAASQSDPVKVTVTGSTLTLTTDNTTITDDGATTATLTITAKDYGDNSISGSTITLSVAGAGGATLDPNSGDTDQDGKLEVTVTGTSAGSVSVTASGLGTTESQTYTVSAPASAFGIISPTDDPHSLTTAETATITVNAPALSAVRFATSLGTLTGTVDGETGAVIAESVVDGTGEASATFSSSLAGLATVQVYDPNNPSMSDTIGMAVTAPVTSAARVQLQSGTYVLKPSVGGVTYTATLTANVRTKGLQVVGDAPVVFSIENPTGGGETISPVVVYTNGSGVATTTFTSGSLSSIFPVIVSARVVDKATTGPLTNIISFDNNNPLEDTIKRSVGSFIDDDFEVGEQIWVKGSASNDGIYYLSDVIAPQLTLEDTKALLPEAAGATVTITAVCGITDPGITIGETAGSVAIGRGTVITKSDDDTYYSLPMSVLVADPNGNPVSGATVSLSAWPAQYSAGAWYDYMVKYLPYISGTFDNEDENENVFLDPGEDTNADGNLTPVNSTAGSLPATVTTDGNGVAGFNLVYLKADAVWITDRIRASTTVLGTEVSSSITFRLPYEKVEGEAGYLPGSPWPVGLTVAAVGGVTSYTFPVFKGSAVDEFTQSLQSGSSFAGVYDYTFDSTAYTPGVSVNDKIWDYISVEGSVTDPVSGATSAIYMIVPIRIIVQ